MEVRKITFGPGARPPSKPVVKPPVKPVGPVGPKELVKKPVTPAPDFGGPGKGPLQTSAIIEPGKGKQVSFKAGPHDQEVLKLIVAQHDGDNAAAIRAAIRHYAFAIRGADATLIVRAHPGANEERLAIKRGNLLC